MVAMLSNIDLDLAAKVASGIGVEEPKELQQIPEADYDAITELKKEWKNKKKVTESPALSMENTKKDTIVTRKIAILVEDGYDHNQLESVINLVKSNGAKCDIVSSVFGMRKSADGREIKTDKTFITTASVIYDALFIPGGRHIEKLLSQGDAIHFANEVFRHCKAIGAMGEGVMFLESTQIKGVDFATEADSGVLTSSGVVTMRGNSEAATFNEEFRKAIAMHRHWQREEKELVPA